MSPMPSQRHSKTTALVVKILALVFLIALTAVAVAGVTRSSEKTNEVAGGSTNNEINISHVEISSPTPTIPLTPAPTGTWTVKDTGQNSRPREAGISYESENTHVNTNVKTSGSDNIDETTNISVTVNGETREIKN